MSAIDKLSSSLGRKDDVPNKKLAKAIVSKNDKKSVKELVEGLKDGDKNQKASILEVLEWVATEKPELVSPYVDEILEQVESKENRLKWGAMIVLARIASLVPQKIWEKKELILTETEEGSVITKDNGVKVLAQVSAQNKKYEKRLVPFLLDTLEYCREKSVPQYAESVSVAVNKANQEEFLKVLKKRLPSLSASQKKRVEKVMEDVKI